jgi:hypothetical protein
MARGHPEMHIYRGGLRATPSLWGTLRATPEVAGGGVRPPPLATGSHAPILSFIYLYFKYILLALT